MIQSDRVLTQMKQRGLSQSELARRVGVTQGAIAKIVGKNPGGSSHLHRIARELGTTPAYLIGETDDPSEDAPAEPSLDPEARAMIDNFLLIGAAERRAVALLVQSLAGAIATSAKVHAPRSALKVRGE